MKKHTQNIGFLLFIIIFFFSCTDNKKDVIKTPVTPPQQVVAFPNADGGGKYATGGRGGFVYYVTNLDDEPYEVGTLRYGLCSLSGARIILFKVSGTISLKSKLIITNGNVTVAGQTAPGDGICLKDQSVYITASNVIIRFMRFRMGDATDTQDDALGAQSSNNILIDHCSMSWSTDECGSFYNNSNFTLQWCILSESLKNSVHGKGAHGYGGIWGGKNASFHHNLLADHDSRNPRFDHTSLYENSAGVLSLLNRGNVDFRNNVVYNWGSNSAYGGEQGTYNMVNNYYKPGPASHVPYFIQPYYITTADTDPNKYLGYGTFYINGNVMEGNADYTANNWNGVQLQKTSDSKAPLMLNAPLDVTAIANTQTAQAAYQSVLAYSGASYKRDTVDKRIIDEATNGTFIYSYALGVNVGQASNGSTNGIIDHQGDVGDWPVLNSLPAPTDSDGDGIPDSWEDANGLNKSNAADGNSKTLDPNGQLTNLEMYLNSLVNNLYPAY